MADNDSRAGASGEPADASSDQPQAPPLVVNAQYVKDLSLEVPNAPEIFAKLSQSPKVAVDVDVRTRRVADDSYEVSLQINARGSVEDQAVFVVELAYGGVFTLANVPQEHIRPLLLIECPRLLFPFARNVIATVTREGGIPPLLINPIDFAALYRNQLRRHAGAVPEGKPDVQDAASGAGDAADPAAG